MKLTRRKFLIGSSLLTLAARASEDEFNLESISKDQIRVHQSVTDDSSTILVVVAHKSRKLSFKVETLSKARGAHWTVHPIDFNLGEFIVYQVHVFRMVEGIEYKLLVDDLASQKTHTRRFSALSANFERLKWGFLTCSSHRRAGPQRNMFNRLKEERVDALIFAGDLVYANSALDTGLGRPAKPEQTFAIYIKTIFELDFYQQEKLTPIFSTWDDHDMGMNNASADHPYLALVTKIFRGFFPADERVRSVRRGPGVSFSMSFKNYRLIFTDCRTFYNPEGEQLYGPLQLFWLISLINMSRSGFALVSSIQFFDYGRLAENVKSLSGWEWGHLERAIKNNSHKALFLSGDVHYSQVQKLDEKRYGYDGFEITSSAVFSLSARFYGKRSDKQGQLDYYGYPNFLVFEAIEIRGVETQLTVRCVSENKNNEFTRTLKLGNQSSESSSSESSSSSSS